MNKRIAAGLFGLLLLVQLAVPPAGAAGSIRFVAIGESILPMSDATMPFWKDGYLYVASSSFSGTARESLNIGQISDSDQVILYSVGRRGTLLFDVGKAYAYDGDGNVYYPGAVVRNGQIFVPASVVASFFGLQYSVTDVRMVVDGQLVQGDLAWIRRSGYSLSEQAFVNAAYFSIAGRYVDYMREKEKPAETDDTPQTPAGTEVEGKRIYLCLEAGETAASFLDALDRYGARAAFFCTPEFLEEQGDLLRRMAATGQAIGILADASDPERSVTEQLEAGNRALALATCGKTRLAYVRGGDDAAAQEAEAAGFRCLEPDLDRSDYDLRTSANASSLLQRVSARRGDVSVWLGENVSAVGLRAFLSAAENADGQCLAWTETA